METAGVGGQRPVDARRPRRSGRRLAAIMLTDVVGSTETWGRLGPDYMAFRSEHKRRVGTLIESYGADFEPTGDGFLAIFEASTDAIECAFAIQRDLERQNKLADDDRAIRVRIVVHIAEVTTDNESDDATIGFAVVSRMESLASAGDIVCSDLVQRLAREHLPPHVFTDPREVELRSLGEPLVVWNVRWQESLPQPHRLPIPLAFADDDRGGFLGRRSELDELSTWLDSAAQRKRRLVLIEGPPGIGKSSLLRQFSRQVHDADRALIMHGACTFRSSTPLEPFAGALTAFARMTIDYPELLGHRPDLLAPLMGDGITLPETAGPSRAGSGTDDDRRVQLYDAIASWLSANARLRPVLFVIDDLHSADAATLRLLGHLLRAEAIPKLLVVAGHRSTRQDWTTAFTEEVGALGDMADAVIGLPGLGRRDIVQALAESDAVEQLRSTDSLADTLWRYTGGNPLFLEGLLRTPGALAALVGDRRSTMAVADVPDEVRRLTELRVRDLDDDTRTVLTTAALIGQQFRDDQIARVAELSGEVVRSALQVLEAAGLTIAPAGDSGLHRFSHQVLRDAVVSAALAADRAEVEACHVTIGTDLLEQGTDLVTTLEAASHLVHAVDPRTLQRGIEATRRAASQARAQLAPAMAAEMIKRELDLQARLPDTNRVERLERTYELGKSLMRAGDPLATATLLDVSSDAADLCAGESDPAVRRSLAMLVANAALNSHRTIWSETGAVAGPTVNGLRRALRLVEAELLSTDAPHVDTFETSRVRLMAALANELSFTRDGDERLALSEEAVRSARAFVAGNGTAPQMRRARKTLARALEERHGVLTPPDGLLDRERLIEELLELQPAVGDPERMFTAWSYAFWTRMELGQTRAAAGDLSSLSEMADGFDEPRLQSVAAHWQSLMACHQGELERAARLAERATSLKSSMGDRDAEVLHIGLMYLPCLHRGTLPSLLDMMRRCVDRTAGLIAIRAGIAVAHLQRGGPDAHAQCADAMDQLDIEAEFDGIAHNDYLVTLALLAIGASAIGDHERCEQIRARLEAHEHLADGRPRYIFNGTSSFGAASHYLGLVNAALGDREAADACFGRADEYNRLLAAPGLVAQTHCAWAEAIVASGQAADIDLARTFASTALEFAKDLGMHDVTRRAIQLL